MYYVDRVFYRLICFFASISGGRRVVNESDIKRNNRTYSLVPKTVLFIVGFFYQPLSICFNVIHF